MGAAAAEGFFHGFSGWFVFMFALAFLLLEMYLLNKLPGSKSGKDENISADKVQESSTGSGTDRIRRGRPVWGSGPLSVPPQFIVIVLLLSFTIAASYGIEFREKIPIAKSFNQFPMQVGEWNGKRDVIPTKFLEGLYFSDYLLADYQNRYGRIVNLYVAYYESQRKAESIHSPETCLPGSGWEFKNAGEEVSRLGGSRGRSMTIMSAPDGKRGPRQICLLLVRQRGRIIPICLGVKLYTFWDALTRQRTDGALVRLITPVLQGEPIEDAEKRLQEFTKGNCSTRSFIPK